MLAGIVYLALGMKKVTEYVADPEHHAPGDPLPVLPLLWASGGVAVYLLGPPGVPAAKHRILEPSTPGPPPPPSSCWSPHSPYGACPRSDDWRYWPP